MIRSIGITAVLNGFIVQVGCQQLLYTSVGELTADLSDYLRYPEATEKRLLKEKGLNRKHTLHGPESVAILPGNPGEEAPRYAAEAAGETEAPHNRLAQSGGTLAEIASRGPR